MRTAGLLVWHALQIAESYMHPGVCTREIDQQVETFFADQKATPLFKGFPGKVPFPAVTCISVNEQVVHGIPGKRLLVEGDIVSVDTGCRIENWCGDAATTFPIGKISSVHKRLLDVCKNTLQIAIDLLPQKQLWSQVAKEMETYVRLAGFSSVDALVGHGIGREMHEDPQVPNTVCRQFLKKGDFQLQPGLVIAIEPMINVGKRDVQIERDHWTFTTKDGKGSAHFEHTIAVQKKGVAILTGAPTTEEERIDITKYLYKG